MNRQDLLNMLADLRHLTLFPRKYKVLPEKGCEYWSRVGREYSNVEKQLDSCDYHWYVLGFSDGHQELTYLRVLQGGLFSGYASAIYRGLLFPRRIGRITFAHIENIRLAF